MTIVVSKQPVYYWEEEDRNVIKYQEGLHLMVRDIDTGESFRLDDESATFRHAGWVTLTQTFSDFEEGKL